jgi:hypothetical protein
VEQAGGRVTGYDGRDTDLRQGRVVSAGAALHPQLLAGLAACQPLAGSSYGAPELDSATDAPGPTP